MNTWNRDLYSNILSVFPYLSPDYRSLQRVCREAHAGHIRIRNFLSGTIYRSLMESMLRIDSISKRNEWDYIDRKLYEWDRRHSRFHSYKKLGWEIPVFFEIRNFKMMKIGITDPVFSHKRIFWYFMGYGHGLVKNVIEFTLPRLGGNVLWVTQQEAKNLIQFYENLLGRRKTYDLISDLWNSTFLRCYPMKGNDMRNSESIFNALVHATIISSREFYNKGGQLIRIPPLQLITIKDILSIIRFQCGPRFRLDTGFQPSTAKSTFAIFPQHLKRKWYFGIVTFFVTH